MVVVFENTKQVIVQCRRCHMLMGRLREPAAYVLAF